MLGRDRAAEATANGDSAAAAAAACVAVAVVVVTCGEAVGFVIVLTELFAVVRAADFGDICLLLGAAFAAK